MGAIISGVLALIQQLLPALGTSTATAALITKIVSILVEITPIVVQEYNDLLPIVKNIITALKADPTTTAAQMIALKSLDLQVDAAFEAAATAAEAEDAS